MLWVLAQQREVGGGGVNPPRSDASVCGVAPGEARFDSRGASSGGHRLWALFWDAKGLVRRELV